MHSRYIYFQAMTTYELHTEAGVRGYDLTAQNYNQSKLPTFEIFLVKVGQDTPSILFDFKQHGLEFGKQNEDWVNFRWIISDRDSWKIIKTVELFNHDTSV